MRRRPTRRVALVAGRLAALSRDLDAAPMAALLGGEAERMTAPEFSRPVRVDTLGEMPQRDGDRGRARKSARRWRGASASSPSTGSPPKRC